MARLLVLLIPLLIGARLAAEDAPLVELDTLLTDGSRLIGTTTEAAFPLETQFGPVALQYAKIHRIELAKEQATLHLRNQDVLVGRPQGEHLILNTLLGELRIPLGTVREISVTLLAQEDADSLKEGLLIHFPFSDQGPVVRNTAEATPGAVLVNGRRENGTVVLDGDEDYVVLNNHPAYEQADAFTISIWARLKSFGPPGYANEYGYLVNKGDNLWWNPCFCLGYSKNSGVDREATPGPAVFTVGTAEKGGKVVCQLLGPNDLEVDRWYHLVGTYDGTRARLYLDGQLEAEMAYDGKLRRDSGPLLLGGGKLGDVAFGNQFTTDATIDNFRFYGRALHAGEVRLLHRREKPKEQAAPPAEDEEIPAPAPNQSRGNPAAPRPD